MSDVEDWTYLWGLVNLGSPKFPGTGNAATWWAPDYFFGINTQSISEYHDWHFTPGAPHLGTISGLFHILGVELDSWLKMFNGDPRWANAPYNPAHWLLQTLFSTLTTTAAILAWWESFRQNANESLGMRDSQGRNPHSRREPYPK
jgi:hypothetical protein